MLSSPSSLHGNKKKTTRLLCGATLPSPSLWSCAITRLCSSCRRLLLPLFLALHKEEEGDGSCHRLLRGAVLQRSSEADRRRQRQLPSPSSWSCAATQLHSRQKKASPSSFFFLQHEEEEGDGNVATAAFFFLFQHEEEEEGDGSCRHLLVPLLLLLLFLQHKQTNK